MGRRSVSKVRLYVDEDAEESSVVEGLRFRGIDVLTTLEAGRCSSTDAKQRAFATEGGRVIFTFNVGHFAALHSEWLTQGNDHSGIAVLPEQRVSIGEKIRRLARLVGSITAEQMVNRMEYL